MTLKAAGGGGGGSRAESRIFTNGHDIHMDETERRR